MRKQSIIAAACVAAGSSAALADGVVTFAPGPWNPGLGGEYQVNRVSGDVGLLNGPASAGQPDGTFQTFCVELLEPLAFDTPYNARFNTVAMGGSYGAGEDGGDPLDPRTAFLYWSFRQGTLEGYRFDGTDEDRREDSRALQRAIWFIEEPGAPEGESNAFVAAANAAGWTDIGLVRVLNIWSRNPDGSDGPFAQDVLTIMVPTPMAACVGFSLMAAIWSARDRRR